MGGASASGEEAAACPQLRALGATLVLDTGPCPWSRPRLSWETMHQARSKGNVHQDPLVARGSLPFPGEVRCPVRHSSPGSTPSLESSVPLRAARAWGARHGPREAGFLSSNLEVQDQGRREPCAGSWRPVLLFPLSRACPERSLRSSRFPWGVGWSCPEARARGPGRRRVACGVLLLQTSSNPALVASGPGAAADIPLTCDLSTGPRSREPSLQPRPDWPQGLQEASWSASQEGSQDPDRLTADVGPACSPPAEMDTETEGGWDGCSEPRFPSCRGAEGASPFLSLLNVYFRSISGRPGRGQHDHTERLGHLLPSHRLTFSPRGQLPGLVPAPHPRRPRLPPRPQAAATQEASWGGCGCVTAAIHPEHLKP